MRMMRKFLLRRNEQRHVTRAPHRWSTSSIHLGWLSLLSREPTLFGCLGWIEGFEPLCVKIDPRIYSQIIRDERVSHGALHVWHLLRDMTGANACCWPSIKTIAKEIHASKDSVLEWITDLEAAGYLRIERGHRHKSNRYFVGGPEKDHGGRKQGIISGRKGGMELNSQIQSIPVSRPSSPTEPEVNPALSAELFRKMREAL